MARCQADPRCQRDAQRSAVIDLSIVIVSHNTAAFLEACLDSIERTKPEGLTLEVIVVDNASSDETADVVRSKHPGVTLIAIAENTGFSRANNRGVAAASGRYLLFLNPDTEMRDGTLARMLTFVEETPQAGAATCFVALPSGALDDAAHRGFPTPWNSLCHFSGLARLFPHSRHFSGYSLGWMDLHTTHEIEALAGAFMLVRREAGQQVGWWDEEYFFYGEDLDFCYRLRLGDWRVYYVPEVSILHYKGMASGIRRESRSRTTASTETRVAATRYRFEAMRIFYRKHLLGRYPRPLTWLVMRAVDLKERQALRSARR